MKADRHAELLSFRIDSIEFRLAQVHAGLHVSRHHHGYRAEFLHTAADLLHRFRHNLRRDHGGVFNSIAAALAEVASPVVVCLGQLNDEVELAYQADGKRVTRIGYGIADLFNIKILAVLLRGGRLPASRVVQKDIPAERRKVRPASLAKTFRQIVLISRPIEVMSIRVDHSKVHQLTSKISGVQYVHSFKPFKSLVLDRLQGRLLNFLTL